MSSGAPRKRDEPEAPAPPTAHLPPADDNAAPSLEKAKRMKVGNPAPALAPAAAPAAAAGGAKRATRASTGAPIALTTKGSLYRAHKDTGESEIYKCIDHCRPVRCVSQSFKGRSSRRFIFFLCV